MKRRAHVLTGDDDDDDDAAALMSKKTVRALVGYSAHHASQLQVAATGLSVVVCGQ